jgi:hypothetical protein
LLAGSFARQFESVTRQRRLRAEQAYGVRGWNSRRASQQRWVEEPFRSTSSAATVFPRPITYPERRLMFDAICTTCCRRELIFAGQIIGLDNADEEIVVTFRCGRGHIGRWRTGRRAVTALSEKSAA